MNRIMSLGLLAVLFFGRAGVSFALPVLVPPSLNPGDTYRIVYVTSALRDAFSSNIDDYNDFVSQVAAASPLNALGTTWKALASTQAVNALTNTGLSISDEHTSFFNTQGRLIATGVGPATPHGLYAGASTAHFDTVFDENGGVLVDHRVWTGTHDDGTTLLPLGDSIIRIGIPHPARVWTSHTQAASSTPFITLTGAIYGVSAELTVPNPVPEPATLVMLSGALLALGIAKRQQFLK